ncbi:glycosyltransferase family 4 protein [Primorskyibacter flagellatus]|uniref:Glycosyltransferase involved in cell wall bisynthesis n=1 Tax=Primorskyibacter flagellatus TaxID=1387277 RepID=A0A1W2E068_9RHOB|nr:glycosyltransferase family 4 protein [Primorskyibacter flagellatus]SMD03143.1 Glycosyltransferase involved in cell wall bisynthesis [Primorskyibacter flagellatus]
MDTPGRMPRIAYLTGIYPLVSLTFIQREIAALRALGAEIETVSCRFVSADQFSGAPEQEAARNTHYLLRAARSPVALLSAQIAALRTPGRYFTALRRALGLRNPGLKSLVAHLAYFLEATMMARFVRQKDIGHIHCHFSTNGPAVAMLTRDLTGVPYSFTLHGPSDLYDPEGKRLGEKAAQARFVATISHYARSQLMLFSAPEHWDRFRIIHCGVNPALYAGERTPRDDKEIRLIFVGRLAPVKGIRVLFEALDDLFMRIPNLRLTLVGDGPDRARLEHEAARLGDRVRFTGYLSQAEVAETLAEHDICVLPSFAEGVPVILMEAMASGLPVIATQVAGVSELIEQGVSGLIAPPGDVKTLRNHIETLVHDPALRDRMGQTGRKKVLAEFDVAGEAKRLALLISGRAGAEIRPVLQDQRPD